MHANRTQKSLAHATLKPGIYRLTRNIKNPRPDRRRSPSDASNWASWVTIPEGMEFMVTQYRWNGEDDPDRIELAPLRGRFSSLGRIVVWDKYDPKDDETQVLADLIAAELVRVEVPDLFGALRLAGHNDKDTACEYIIDLLIETGRLTIDQAVALADAATTLAAARWEATQAKRDADKLAAALPALVED